VAKITQPLTFYAEVIRVLEEIAAPYMIIGAFAAAAYGTDRTTHDVDLIVNLQETHIRALVPHFPSPRYYADPEQMRRAMRDGSLFNIIDSERGEKVDLIPITLDARYRDAFARRIRLAFEDLNGELVEAWYARPDDVIVGKLMAWDEGRSAKHPYDIAAMMAFLYRAQDPTVAPYFDEKYVDSRARTISSAAASLWAQVKRQARSKKKNE
jgi:hypothetical protein